MNAVRLRLSRAIAFIIWCTCIGACASPSTQGDASTPSPQPTAESSAPPHPAQDYYVGEPVLVKESDPLHRFKIGDTIQAAIWKAGVWAKVLVDGLPVDSIQVVLLGARAGGTMVVSTSSLNLRKCPATTCAIQGHLGRDDVVTVNEFRDGWYHAEQGGWANASYLQLASTAKYLKVTALQLSFGLWFDEATKREGTDYLYAWDLGVYGQIISLDISASFEALNHSTRVCEFLAAAGNQIEKMIRADKAIKGYRARVVGGSDHDRILAFIGADRGVNCARR